MPDYRAESDAIYLRLSQQLNTAAEAAGIQERTSVTELRDRALQLTDPAAVEFNSAADEALGARVLEQLINDGSLASGQLTPEDASAVYSRIAEVHGRQPWEPGYSPDSSIRIDPLKGQDTGLGRDHDSGVPQASAALTAPQEAEQDRLVSLSNDLAARPSRPSYGAASGAPGLPLAGITGRPPASSSAPGLSERTLQIIEASARLAPELFGNSAQELRLSAGQDASDPVVRSPRVLRLAGQAAAQVHDVDEDATDHDQPHRGGTPHPRSVEAIMKDNPDLFGDPDAAGGTTVLRPKSPAQRARERRASRPGHSGADWS